MSKSRFVLLVLDNGDEMYFNPELVVGVAPRRWENSRGEWVLDEGYSEVFTADRETKTCFCVEGEAEEVATALGFRKKYRV